MAFANRSTKPNGTGSWVINDVLSDTGLNGDVDNILAQLNGNIQNVNVAAAAGIVYSKLSLSDSILNADINSAAAIALSKIAFSAGSLDAVNVDDHAADDPTYLTITSPGTTGSTSRPTNLEQEIQRIRYVLKRLGIGVTVDLEDGTSDAGWIEPPARPHNHIFNGDFQSLDTLDASTDGNGYTRILGANVTSLTRQGTPVVAEGPSGGALIVTDAAEAGIQQTVNGLRASTKYLIRARVRATSGTAHLVTDHALAGGSYENLDLSTTGTAFVTLAGIIETDTTPTAIDVRVLSDGAAATFEVKRLTMVELDEEYTELPASMITTSSVGPLTVPGVNAAITGLSASVTPPGPNYAIYVTLSARTDPAGGGTVGVAVQIEENASGVNQSVGSFNNTTAVAGTTVHFTRVQPTPGTTFTYTANWDDNGGTASPMDNGYAWLTVELRRLG